MDGIYFAFGNIAVCIAIYWCMTNERPPLADRTRGLLAMPNDDPIPLAAIISSRRSGKGQDND